MNEKDLREMIRTEILKKLNENPEAFSRTLGGTARSGLGRARQPIDTAFKKLDVDRLAKLPRQQKVNLLTSLLKSVGISSRDFNAIRARVSRELDSE
jgi:hypothetical protein